MCSPCNRHPWYLSFFSTLMTCVFTKSAWVDYKLSEPKNGASLFYQRIHRTYHWAWRMAVTPQKYLLTKWMNVSHSKLRKKSWFVCLPQLPPNPHKAPSRIIPSPVFLGNGSRWVSWQRQARDSLLPILQPCSLLPAVSGGKGGTEQMLYVLLLSIMSVVSHKGLWLAILLTSFDLWRN